MRKNLLPECVHSTDPSGVFKTVYGVLCTIHARKTCDFVHCAADNSRKQRRARCNQTGFLILLQRTCMLNCKGVVRLNTEIRLKKK